MRFLRPAITAAAVLFGLATAWAHGERTGYRAGEAMGRLRGTFEGARGVMTALTEARYGKESRR